MSHENSAEYMDSIRAHAVACLRGGQAFDSFDEIVASFTPDQRGEISPGAGHSAWQVVEHMRISQRDILDFSRNDDGSYVEMNWPDDYWPKESKPPTSKSWDESVTAFLSDRKELEELIASPESDLFAPLSWGDGQTLLREGLMAADHAAYHLGQLVILQRLLSTR